MARVRRIVVSQIEGGYSNNSDKRPNGEIALYDDNDNGFDLVIHDGVNSTNENKVLGKGKLYGHNGSFKIIAGPTSSVEWSFNLDGDLVLPEGGDIKDYFGSSVLSSTLLEVTYSELVNMIDESLLTPGKFYKITDFRTCYDVPLYNVLGNPKYGAIDYIENDEQPIIVLATSTNTINSTAYQPSYPNDRIQYDWNWSSTNTTGGTAYGRITERIDEFNNRTDYDHRNIYFNRFQSYEKTSKLTGTLESYNSATGIVIGTETSYTTEVSENDVLLFEHQGSLVGFKVVTVDTDTQLSVVVDISFGSQIDFTGGLLELFKSEPTEYFNEYKEVYVGQKNEGDWSLASTFNLDGSSIHNYIGDYSKFYLNELGSGSGFLLANNVFYGNRIYSNTIGDRSYNNTGRYWFVRNTIDGRFYNNVIHDNGFYSNSIGEYFHNNNIKSSMYSNTTAEGFNNNTIEGEFYDNTINVYFENNHTYSQFNKNTIANSCSQNVIYSDFYENNIGLYFGSNVIGDKGNLGRFNFYRNKIGNNFQDNNIRQDFQNNQIGNQFEYNNVYGDFYKNVIGNGFNSNDYIGHNFYGNHIGNGFNDNNYIGDYFKNNQIGEYFENNYITNNFRENSIGNLFENNTLGDTQYFTWDNTSIENLTDRNYSTFYNSLYGDGGENIGNVILGKELIMRFSRNSGTIINSGDLIIGETYEITNYIGTDDFTDVADVKSGVINTNGCVFIATGPKASNWSSQSELTELTSYDEYHKIKFTQWTQNSNGGGFSYERTKVYPTSEPTVYFTKLNYASNVDVIIPGRLEIKRNNDRAIYNFAVEGNFNDNVSPQGTEWNSIYTQNQDEFSNNEIQNEFKGNLILREFSENKIRFGFSSNILYGQFISNITDGVFYSNDVNSFYSNRVGDQFWDNTIGDNFNNNEVGNWFSSNNIAPGFSNNKIGKNFDNNNIEEGFGFGAGDSQNNIIGDYFQDNNIGEYFYNNKVSSYFQNNDVGYYFQRNNIDTPIYEEDFIVNYGNIVAFTYQSSGTTSTPGFYNSLGGITNRHGENATFGITISGGTISVVGLVSAGNQYEVGDSIIIPGNNIGGQTGVIKTFTLNDSPTGLLDGTYTGLTVSGGTGENALFDIDVFSGSIFTINLNNGGGGYIFGNTVSIIGSYFGGTNSVNDVTITVDSIYSDDVTIRVTEVSATPSVYEMYNCQIFERKGGNRRLSFYDENDILTIKNINE